jgi:hypothetical protein
MSLDSTIWGPHYWFTLHTIAFHYPSKPNEVIKKKYYNFIQNIPLFIPNEKMGNDFIELLDKYPVSPYLDSKLSFIKWMHFIHNKINEKLYKPQISLQDSIKLYYDNYKVQHKQKKNNNKMYYIFVTIILALLIYFLYS